MVESAEREIASLLAVLSFSEDETEKCPLGIFARSLRSLLQEKGGDALTLCDTIAVESMELLKEEERIIATKKMISLTYDKLKAEVARLEAQMREQESRLKEVTQQRKMCRLALNALVAGDVPRYVDAKAAAEVPPVEPLVIIADGSDENLKGHDEATTLSEVAPVVHFSKNTVLLKSPTATSSRVIGKGANRCWAPEMNQTGTRGQGGTGFQSPSLPSSAVNSTSLLVTLRLPELKETSLLHAIESFELQTFTQGDDWISTERYPDICALLLDLLKNLPESRPPVQLAELRLLEKVFQTAPTSNELHNQNLLGMLEALLTKGRTIFVLISLLNSVNDDVKCAALECLSSFVCGTYPFLTAGFVESVGLCQHARREFLDSDGLKLLIHIVTLSSSEAVMECALLFLWGLLSKDDRTDSNHLERRPVCSSVIALGGLSAVLDLLFTDSLIILENVCMVIGYLTRDNASKKEIRETGGLEKLISTLRHFSTSIKAKIAGAIWNCASDEDNRNSLHNLGGIPALLGLFVLNSSERDGTAAQEFLFENVAGALWNLSVDSESKKQIVAYGGIPLLIEVLTASSSLPVLENITGTLWNCSSSVEVRSEIFKFGGIPPLLSLLNVWKTDASDSTVSHKPTLAAKTILSEKVFDNVSGTLRNCVLEDRFKPLICESGGIRLLLHHIQRATLDAEDTLRVSLPISTVEKMVATLWVLTTLPDSKIEVAHNGGIEMLVKVLESSSPVLAAVQKFPDKGGSLFSLIKPREREHLESPSDFFEAFFSPDVLQKIPSLSPIVPLSMGIREMIVGVLRNCSTVLENRKRLVNCGAVRCLISVVLDCYSSKMVFTNQSVRHKNVSREKEPSMHLKECVSSAIRYLSREDKVVLREQGGLELMCMLLLTPLEPGTVLEQAVGAISSLTSSNLENKEAIRQYGGLHALVQMISNLNSSECFSEKKTPGKDTKMGVSNRNDFLYNALLTIRNVTLSNKKNMKYCGEAIVTGKDGFGDVLLHTLQHGSEECAREVAMIVRNLCTLPGMVGWFECHDVSAILNQLSESVSSDSVRRAINNAKHTIFQTLQ
ncbi:unnamed protein product [Phytomonas sp. Hart1]|nr:unnamed protein product [Phytomonas sp. Hart1]|eukprot:CCW70516.1 unnamed protein product [Phytomonas sp. isolate Hart1]